MSGWVPVCPAGAWRADEEGGRVFRFGQARVAVFRHAGSWFAMDDRCPHERFGLSGGELVGEAVRCPGHGWTFALSDGRAVRGPEGMRVRVFPVRERGGNLEVDLSDAREADA
ncbi:MAG: Rieske (2Fe-2S) protein [Spirochaetes bacterium]|nr:Rieske (2Fe-2S) protein [Spirochaetota bacterium]